MKIIGHRGAAAYAPENTLSSFQKAIDMGVSMIELDVTCCKTGEVVVIHDDTVDRTTNGHGFVSQITLSELQLLTINGSEHIPTLDEVFDLVNQKIPINIELKNREVVSATAQAIETRLKQGWNPSSILISSFNHFALRDIQQRLPQIPLGVLISSLPLELAKMRSDLNAYSIHPDGQCIEQTMVADAHTRGLKVFVWTVNDREQAMRLNQWGVDGIFTDKPDILL